MRNSVTRTRKEHRRTISTPDVLETGRQSIRYSVEKRDIPHIVSACIDYIDMYGLKVEGIFRVNGDLKLAETILHRASSEKRLNLHSALGSGSPDTDTCRTVASLLKMYFRNLPTPLFPYSIYKSVLRHCRNGTKLKEIVHAAMNKPTQDCLCEILRLCQRISGFAKTNMMHPNALSICWGASLIKAPPSNDDSMMFAAAMDAGKRNKVIETMISNLDNIFPPKPSASKLKTLSPTRTFPSPPPTPCDDISEEDYGKKSLADIVVPLVSMCSSDDDDEEEEEEEEEEDDDDEEEEENEENDNQDEFYTLRNEKRVDEDEEEDDEDIVGEDDGDNDDEYEVEEEEEDDDDEYKVIQEEEEQEEEEDDDDDDEYENEVIQEEEEQEKEWQENEKTEQLDVITPTVQPEDEMREKKHQQEENKQKKMTPLRRTHRSIETSPLQRFERLASPPVPKDASTFQQCLLTRPFRSDIRLPEDLCMTKKQQIITSQKSITKFLSRKDTQELQDDIASSSSSSSDVDDDEKDEDEIMNNEIQEDKYGEKRNEKLERLVSFTAREEIQEQQTESTWICVSCNFLNLKLESFENKCVICGHEDDDLKIHIDEYVKHEDEEEEKVQTREEKQRTSSSSSSSLKEQNKVLQHRLKRLEQQIAMMQRSAARRSLPHALNDQRKRNQSATLMAQAPVTKSVYAQGDAFRMTGWSLFGRWKQCFCRIVSDKLLCWDSREDALGGQKADVVISLHGQEIQLCMQEDSKEESYFRIVTKKSSSTQLRMRGLNKKGSAYWFARLKDKELELEFEQDLYRRCGDLAKTTEDKNIEPHITSETRLLTFLRSPSAFGSHARPPVRELDLSVLSKRSRNNKRVKGISSSAVYVLSESLKTHFYLRSLSLRGSLRSSRHLSLLSKALEHNASLTSLDLSDNKCSFSNGAIPIEFIDAMRTNGSIREVVLDRNGIAENEIKMLVPGLLHNVTTLSLRSNRIDDESVCVLVDHLLLRSKSLRSIDLASNEIGDKGAIRISKALSSTTLHNLDLSRNSIGDDGATSIASSLKESSALLRTLHLESNPFTSTGSRHVAQMARVNLSLTQLSFATYVLDNSALQSLRVAFDFF